MKLAKIGIKTIMYCFVIGSTMLYHGCPKYYFGEKKYEDFKKTQLEKLEVHVDELYNKIKLFLNNGEGKK